MFSSVGSTQPPCSSKYIDLSADSLDILDRLKKINASFLFTHDSVLQTKLERVSPIDLKRILEKLLLEVLDQGLIKDPLKFLDRLAVVIPFEKMQGAIECEEFVTALEEAKSMFEAAKYQLQSMKENNHPATRNLLSSLFDGVISVIESVIAAFGIEDFFKPPEGDFHADLKFQKIMMLLTLFSMITTMLVPILGPSTAALVVGGTIFGISAISIIWPFIKPITTHLPANAENWTKQVCSVAQGRKESLDAIDEIIEMNRHALLVGPSRVGKSLTAKAFARAVERGDYPKLKGMVVFRINTTDLVDQKASFLGGGNSILNKISREMGRHRDRIILVLDEIHSGCKPGVQIADQLKTFLDEHGEFPHVIGITTEREYEEYVQKNVPFSRRFEKVDIKNTTEEETLKILYDIVLKSHSKPIIKPDAINRIYEKSSSLRDSQQPADSIRILERCIIETEKIGKSPAEKEMREVDSKISCLTAQVAACRGYGITRAYVELDRRRKELQDMLSKEKEKLGALSKSKELLNLVTKDVNLMVIKVDAIAKKSLPSNNIKELKLFILLHHFLGKMLESRIEETARELGVKASITKELVDSIE